MNTAEVVKLTDQVFETWNNHDAEKFLTLCDESIVWSVSKGPEVFKGKNQVKEYFNGWKTAFPDFKLKIRNRIIDGDQYSVEFEFTGTHKGKFQARPGMPEISPTNKKVSLGGIYTAKLKNGRLAEITNYPDRLGLMEQIGVLEGLHLETH